MVTASRNWFNAWQAMKIDPARNQPRQRFTDSDFDALKTQYTAKYGYEVSLPDFSDIVHLKPTFTQTAQEIKAKKQQNLQRILASPMPEWSRPYTTVMTWIDNIQDHASLIYPMYRMLLRWSPKIFARMLPGMGWMLLGFDILSFLTTLGRAPFAPLRAKRATCQLIKSNPFTKKAQMDRVGRIKAWNPGFSDLLQVLQVTDQWTGFGLSLGAAMGYAMDAISGGLRLLSGQQVSFNYNLPPRNIAELKSSQALKAAAAINSAGQLFDEETHFWSLMTQAAATKVLTPYVEQTDFSGSISNPLDILAPAPIATDPVTIEVIREAGLDLDQGVGFPHNGDKETPLKDLVEWHNAKASDSTRDFLFRHEKDNYGFVAARVQNDSVLDLATAMEPEANLFEEDTPITRVMFAMIKAPILPAIDPTKEQGQRFEKWVNDYEELNASTPTLKEIRQELERLGIPYKTQYPDQVDPAASNLYDSPFSDADFQD